MPKKYRWKMPIIEAAEVKINNMDRVAAWCGGTVVDDPVIGPHITLELRDRFRGSYRTSVKPGEFILHDPEYGFVKQSRQFMQANYELVEEKL